MDARVDDSIVSGASLVPPPPDTTFDCDVISMSCCDVTVLGVTVLDVAMLVVPMLDVTVQGTIVVVTSS